MSAQTILIRAAAVADAAGTSLTPGSVLLRLGDEANVLAIGSPAEVLDHPAGKSAQVIELPQAVVLPGLVNAHTHLDLSHIGPIPYGRFDGFASWAESVRSLRCTNPDDVAASVREGILMCLRGGVVAVGDIAGAGSLVPLNTLRSCPLRGVCFIEVFGCGSKQSNAVQFMKATAAEDQRSILSRAALMQLGLQPHAPYSAGLDVYRAAANIHDAYGIPIATHLSESDAEQQYIARGTGPLREMLTRIGVWEDSFLASIAHGASPIEYLRPVLQSIPILAIHVNDCTDEELKLLAESNVTVVYCPRASEYFGHERRVGGHRYREMIDAGIPVVLGTDSIISVPATQAGRLSTLDDMRLLYRRDRIDSRLLLRLATTAGAEALGIEPDLFRFHEGQMAGILAVKVARDARMDDPLRAVFESDSAPELLWPKPTSN